MDAKDKGYQKAYERITKQRLRELGLMDSVLNKLPGECKGKIHNKAGVCPKCNTKFVKWSCKDEKDKFLLEIYLPYYSLTSSSPLNELV